MKNKLFLLFFFICLFLGYSQSKKNNSFDINITFGRAPDCFGYSGICTFQIVNQEKSVINNVTKFILNQNELKLILNKSNLTDNSIDKLLHNKLTKGFYKYVLIEDFILSKEIKKELKIYKFNQIKKGVYLIRERDNQIFINFKLE